MVDNWNLNSKEDPVREAVSWKDQPHCDRILEIMQKNSSGQRGNPGKEVFFVDKDGCRIRMALKLFKAGDSADQHIADLKEKAPKKSAREKLDSLLKNKSVASSDPWLAQRINQRRRRQEVIIHSVCKENQKTN